MTAEYQAYSRQLQHMKLHDSSIAGSLKAGRRRALGTGLCECIPIWVLDDDALQYWNLPVLALLLLLPDLKRLRPILDQHGELALAWRHPKMQQ